jgi:hypothetical protein
MENEALFLREFFNETLYRVTQSATNPKGTDILEQNEKPNSLPLSGDKSADVLLLFSYPGKKDIPAPDREVLTAMLKAVQLSWQKVAFLNMDEFPSLTWEQVLQSFGGTRLLVFQENAAVLPELCEEGKIMVIDGRKILCTAPMQILEENKSRKMMLWKGLQEMFGL